MIAFDPIDISETFDFQFSLVEDEDLELESNFMQLGYESAFFVSNLGSLSFVITFQLFLIPVLILLSKCQAEKCKRVKNWSSDKMDKIFFNVLLTEIDGTFLVVLLMAVINIKQVA